jgi:DNA-binding HxlR family transcriptional regulator
MVSWDREIVPTEAGATTAPTASCPVEVALSAISGRWTTLLLRDLMSGPLTYSQLAARLPTLSDKVLADRLRSLVNEDLVERRAEPGFPVRTYYQLTARGKQLRPLLIELYRTGLRLQEADQDSRASA